MGKTITGVAGIEVFQETNTGLVLFATYEGDTIPATADIYAKGCIVIHKTEAKIYQNTGTSASPSFNNVGDIVTADIADGAITPAKLRATAQTVTATADGLTTGLITQPSAFRTFVAATSAAATNALTLPAASAATIGQEIWITVGANGYELLTPASGNNTINLVDSDGTNQLDVAANTTLICVQVSATGWLAIQVAAATITVVAPDND